MITNAVQSTTQCVSTLMVIIPGYLEWSHIDHGKISSPIHNCTGDAKDLRGDKTNKIATSRSLYQTHLNLILC